MLSSLKKVYLPLNTIEISEAALKNNYSYLTSLSDMRIAPVLKSNAYGHGLVLTGKLLDQLDAPFFCVDSIYEGYELLNNAIKTPILIMGYVSPQNLTVKKLPFSYAVSTKQMLETVVKYQPHAGIHIFVDTGMHREGFAMQELPELIRFIKSKNVTIEGLMSHFGASDCYDDLTRSQVSNFVIAQELFHAAELNLKWIHHANSSGMLNYKNYKGKIGNMARAGIALYGVDPERKNKQLEPTVRFSSTLTQIKDLKKDESSGYDFTFVAKKDMKIGVVAAGYYDGVDRRLSSKGLVKIEDTYCQIIGRVSMNLTMIDISNVKNPAVGDRVEIFSNNPKDKNSFSQAAKLIDTIAYDLLVKLAASTKRIIV